VKRTNKIASAVFQQVLRQAEEELALAGKAAKAFDHRGVRGDERASSLEKFLAERLPSVFVTGKGEAIDFRDARSGQIDLCIYDRATAAPILAAAGNALIPAEALYVVIEVKSVLTQDELDKCALAADKIRKLRPFKREFVAAPLKGAANKDNVRCLHLVFAYTTNLSEKDWAGKELERIEKACEAIGAPTDLLDRVIVLDRGMIRPQVRSARVREEATGIFLDFYIHLANFLTRERGRRPQIDWEAYSATKKWIRIT
jgi:hypothetical protein